MFLAGKRSLLPAPSLPLPEIAVQSLDFKGKEEGGGIRRKGRGRNGGGESGQQRMEESGRRLGRVEGGLLEQAK